MPSMTSVRTADARPGDAEHSRTQESEHRTLCVTLGLYHDSVMCVHVL